MTEELKQARVTRRNAKSALTRVGKSLRHAIARNRPRSEITECFLKVQSAYDKLTEKHEEFTTLIEDDKEFEQEEAWFEECQDDFMRLEIETKEYIEAVAKDKVSMQENSQESNTNEGSSAIISAAKESNEESLNNSGISGMQATGQESINTCEQRVD